MSASTPPPNKPALRLDWVDRILVEPFLEEFVVANLYGHEYQIRKSDFEPYWLLVYNLHGCYGSERVLARQAYASTRGELEEVALGHAAVVRSRLEAGRLEVGGLPDEELER